MTFEEILVEAKTRALDLGAEFPSAKSVLYRQIEQQQQLLFTKASRVNPDYFGVNACGELDTSFRVDLRDLEGAVGVDPASSITRIEICDAGTHPTLVAGDEVFVVTENDIEAELAPRVTLRNFIVRGVGTDLTGIVSLCVHYGYRPENKTAPLDGTETAELPDIYQELLVVGLATWMIRVTISLDPEKKAAALGVLGPEEQELLAAFMAEIADYAGAQRSRFGSVQGTQRV